MNIVSWLQKQKVYIQFTPMLDEDEIKEEALRMIEKAKKVVKAAVESQEKLQLQVIVLSFILFCFLM